MDGGVITGLGAGTAEDAQIAESLHSQLSGLQELSGRLGRARDGLRAVGGDGVWRGEAHRRYLSALEQLVMLVHSASRHVDDAIGHTRLALATGGHHGG